MRKRKLIHFFILLSIAAIAVYTVFWQTQYAKYGRGFDQMASYSLGTQAFLELKWGHYLQYDPEGYKEANRCAPVAFYVSAVMMLVFGPSFSVMASTNLIFFFLLLGAIYLLAARRGGSAVGLIAASFVLVGYAFIKYLLTWNSDMAGASLVAWTIVVLDDENPELKIWKLALLGLMLQLGIQTRLTYPLFVLVPVGYVLAREIRSTVHKMGLMGLVKSAMRWSIPVLIYSISSACFPKERSLLGELKTVEMEKLGEAYRPFHTLQDVPFYIDWWNELGLLFLLVALVGLVWSAFRERDNVALMLLWACIPAIGFAYFAVNATRLMLPAWPAFAVMAAMPFTRIDRSKADVLAIVILAFALTLFFTKASDGMGLTQPPLEGSGWEPYEARDLELSEVIRGETNPILFVDKFSDRIFSTYMLPSQIVFQNPKRPFFKLSYEYEYEQILEVYDLMASRHEDIHMLIVRQPAEVEASWDEGEAESYYHLLSSMGRLNLNKTVELMKNIMTVADGMHEVFQGEYFYGKSRMRIIVLRR